MKGITAMSLAAVLTLAAAAVPAPAAAQATPPGPAPSQPRSQTTPAAPGQVSDETTPSNASPAKPPLAAPATPGMTVTDAALQTFAAAWVDVKKINDEYQPRIAAATGDAQAALKTEQNERMMAAIKAHGMDVVTFNHISHAANRDPALKARVADAITKAQAADQEAPAPAPAPGR